MNIRLLPLLGLCFTIGLHAQGQASGDPASPLRSMQELKEMVGPIALYPDPLISLVLPASTVPADIVVADRFVAGGGDLDHLDGKPWDASIKALTRYPDTLKWLDDNLDWTSQLGDAFTNQPDDVMSAIQAMRSQAKALGNLADTPEQVVVADDTSIRIVPAQPDYIYVPRYDPEVIYYRAAPPDDYPIYFSTPYFVGPWLSYDFDWHHHRLYRGEWHRGWDYGRDTERSRGSDVFINNNLSNTTVWSVNTKRRISSGAAKSGGRGKSFSAAKLAVVKPTTIPKTSGLKPGTQPKPPLVPKLGSTGKTGTASKIAAPKLQGATTGVLKPKMPAPGIKGETINPNGETIKSREERRKTPALSNLKAEAMKPKGDATKSGLEAHKAGSISNLKGEPIKPKGDAIKSGEDRRKTPAPSAPHKEAPKPHVETPKPHVEAHKEAPKPHVETPKPHVEAHKEAPKPHAETPKPHVEAHKEAPKPHVEAHKEAPKPTPKPHTDTSKDGKKKDKKDQKP